MTDQIENMIEVPHAQPTATAQANTVAANVTTSTNNTNLTVGQKKKAQWDNSMKFFLEILTRVLFIIDSTTPKDSTKAAAEMYAKAYSMQVERETKQLLQFMNEQSAMLGTGYNITSDAARVILNDNVQVTVTNANLVQTDLAYTTMNQSLSTEYPLSIYGLRAESNQNFGQAFMPLQGRKMHIRRSSPLNIDISSVPSVVNLFAQLQLKLDNKITDLNVNLTGAPLYQKALLAARISHQGFFSLEAKTLNSVPTTTLFRIMRCILGTLGIETNFQLPVYKRFNIQTNQRVQYSYSSNPELRRGQIPYFNLNVYYITLADWVGFMTDTYEYPGNPNQQIPPFTREDFNFRFNQNTMIHIDSTRLDLVMLQLLVTNFIMDTSTYRYIRRYAFSQTDRQSTAEGKLFMDDWTEPAKTYNNPTTILLIDIKGGENMPQWLFDVTDLYRADNPVNRYDDYFVTDADTTWLNATGLSRNTAADYYRRFTLLYPTASALAVELLSTISYGTAYLQLIKNISDSQQATIPPAALVRKPPDTGSDPAFIQNCNCKYMYATQMPLVNTTASQQAYAGVNYDTVFSALYLPCTGLLDATLLPYAEDQGPRTGGVPMPSDGVYAFLWDIVFPMLASQNTILIKGLSIPTPTDFFITAYTKSFINIAMYDYLEANTFFPAPVATFDQVVIPVYGQNITPNSSRDLIAVLQAAIPFKPFAYDLIDPRTEEDIQDEMYLKLEVRPNTTMQVINGPPTFDPNSTGPTHRYNSFFAKRRHISPELYFDIPIITAAEAFAPITTPETRPTIINEDEYDMRAFWQMHSGPDVGYAFNDGLGTMTRYISFNTAAIPSTAKKHVCMTIGIPVYAIALPTIPGTPVTLVAQIFTNVDVSPYDTQLSSNLRASSTFQDTTLRTRLYMEFLQYNRSPRFVELVWPKAYLFLQGTTLGRLVQDSNNQDPNKGLKSKRAAFKNISFRD
jgi:hypothetical protein